MDNPPSSAESTDWSTVRASTLDVPEHVVFRSFATETVLLNVQTGFYYGLDEVGGRFFTALRDASSPDEAASALAAEYAQPAERIQEDLARFIGELEALDLVSLSPSRS